MPTLILMRHGQAQSFAASDENRPLTTKGQAQVAAQAAKQTIPWHTLQRVWVSPYLRTQQTYVHLLSAIEQFDTQPTGQKPASTNDWIYETSPLITPHGQPETVQEWLLQQPLVDTLLITHQPLISQLIGFFDKGDINAGPPMSPASIVVLTGTVFARGCMHAQGVFHV